MPWLTGDVLTPIDFLYRRVRIPNDLALIMAVNGALLDLTKVYNWQEFGDETAEEAAALMSEMFYDYLDSNVNMIGAIFPYVTEDPPANCLPCDGSEYDAVDYPRLWGLLDPFFYSGPDTFVTPDLRGRSVLGAGTGTGLSARGVGDIGGEETHVLTATEMPAHTHTEGIAVPAVINGGIEAPAAAATPSTGITGSTGADGAHENMPPFFTLNYCMVAR